MGPRFSWCNFMINTIALDYIHISLVKHLLRVALDHCPILLEVFKPLEHIKNIIRYEEVWASYYGASALVKSVLRRNCKGDPASVLNVKFKRTLKALFYWSKEKYKDLNVIRDKLKDEILEIQLEESEGEISVERLHILRFKINELNITLARINTWWRQRAKARWMDEGNYNTSFFHAVANARRSSNWINHIKTGSGIFSEEEAVISDTFSDFFRHKWKFRDCILDGWPRPSNVISLEDQRMMDADFLQKELQVVVESSKRSIYLGIDGISFSFIKDFWQIIKGDIWLAVEQFLNSGVMNESWKETLIVLIPKIKSPQEPVHYRPISLCLTIYKLIAKMLLNRIERIIHKIISTYKAAFVRARSLSDHVLLDQEVFNKFRWSKARSGMFAINLDMEQAYDSMGWQTLRFLHGVTYIALLRSGKAYLGAMKEHLIHVAASIRPTPYAALKQIWVNRKNRMDRQALACAT
ncbi:uncharacterized protein LOC110116734 [Dendrobium catenatum]|uniref:uncharacterized protein LOC110116734 n=1 Tax=Dendrobium catenatum TaxID=906689 RepID=UPI0009F6DEA2|nr:uncharacterized protein LOC110116734 [Dendrobium catenatum]